MTATAYSPSIDATPTVTRRRGVPGWNSVGWLGRVGAAIIVVAAIVAIFGPLLAPFPPNHSDLAYAFVGGSPTHPLGFDSQGRDLLSRLLVGARSSMLGAFIVIALAMTAGTFLAILAAWRRGWVDNLISSGSDLAFAFPGLLLAVLTAAVFGPSQWSAAASLSSQPRVLTFRRSRPRRRPRRSPPSSSSPKTQSSLALWPASPGPAAT